MVLLPPLLLPLLSGCADAPLAPDADLAGDPMLAALPAEAPLVARLEVDPADARALAATGWYRPAALPLTALPTRTAAACDDAGCVALIEGETAPLLPALGPHRWEAQQGPHRFTWSRLATDRAVAGEASAVETLRRTHAGDAALLDPTRLDGLVPAGELWVVARDAEALHSLAAARGIDLPPLPPEAADVQAVALAVDLDDGTLAWTLRLTARDAAAARRAAAAADRLVPGLPLLDRARVARADHVVELQGGWLTLDELAGLEHALLDAGVLR